MDAQDTNEKKVSLKNTRKRRGLLYLAIAVVFIIVSVVLYSVDIGGVIFALVSLGWVVFLIMGLVYLIRGLVGKE